MRDCICGGNFPHEKGIIGCLETPAVPPKAPVTATATPTSDVLEEFEYTKKRMAEGDPLAMVGLLASIFGR